MHGRWHVLPWLTEFCGIVLSFSRFLAILRKPLPLNPEGWFNPSFIWPRLTEFNSIALSCFTFSRYFHESIIPKTGKLVQPITAILHSFSCVRKFANVAVPIPCVRVACINFSVPQKKKSKISLFRFHVSTSTAFD